MQFVDSVPEEGSYNVQNFKKIQLYDYCAGDLDS